MTESASLSTLITPFIEHYRGQRLLLVGERVQQALTTDQDTRSHKMTTPLSRQALADTPPCDMAIISDLVESLPKTEAIECLAALRNQYVQKILLIVDPSSAASWQLSDYLALGFKQRGQAEGLLYFSYAIEDYQFKKDWLNSRYWANPENFDKYRW